MRNFRRSSYRIIFLLSTTTRSPKKFLTFLMSYGKKRWYGNKCSTCGKTVGMKIMSLTLIKTFALNTHIRHIYKSYEKKGRCRSSMWGYMLYNFKLGVFVVELSRRTCQTFGDNAVNECTVRNWLHWFISKYLPLLMTLSVVGADFTGRER